jgi:hypothetical protein
MTSKHTTFTLTPMASFAVHARLQMLRRFCTTSGPTHLPDFHTPADRQRLDAHVHWGARSDPNAHTWSHGGHAHSRLMEHSHLECDLLLLKRSQVL